MVNSFVAAFLLVIGFADLVTSRAYVPAPFFPQQTQQSSCLPIGSLCEQFNILSQCCPGLVCNQAILPGVKVSVAEYRCETLYGGGYIGGIGPGIGGIGGGIEIGAGYGTGFGGGYGMGLGYRSENNAAPELDTNNE